MTRTYKQTLVIISTLFWFSTHTKVIVYAENAYAMPAPQELVDKVEHIAEQIDFTQPYELVIPKKPGIEINPWNKFIASAINPESQNFLVIVNPTWLSSIPEDEQTFLVGRALMRAHTDALSHLIKLLPYLYALISLLLILTMFFALKRHQYQVWLRILMAIAFTIACEFAFMDTLYTRFLQYLHYRYDAQIHELVLEKTGDKDAALRALQRYQDAINDEFKNGEILFAPYTQLFTPHIQALKDTK